jgi:hypothetical protein
MAAPVCAISFAIGPSRSRRADSEAWSVAGTIAEAVGIALTAPASNTAFVNSSRKSGTPSVRSTISSTTSADSAAALPKTPRTSSLASSRPNRRSDNAITCGWSVHGGWNSARKVATSSTGRP